MAMYIHSKIWQEKLNRTLIFSILMVFWTFFIELYFLFFPEAVIKENAILSWLYFDLFGFPILLTLFHTLIWGVCFFFTWFIYTIFKDKSNSGQATVLEFFYVLGIFSFFIVFLNNVIIAFLFIIFSLGEFAYLYLALADS